MPRPSSIDRSRHKQEIIECLESGWSPETITFWLKRRFGDGDPDVPSIRPIYRYRKYHISSNRLVPTSVIKQQLKGIDYKVDLLGTLARIIWVLEDRVANNWEREKETSGGVASPNTDRAALTLLEYLREYRRVAQDLGLLPSRPDSLQVEMHQTQAIVVSHEDVKDLAEALALTKGSLSPGVP